MGFSQNKTTHFIPNEKNELIAKQDATSNDNYEKEIEKEFPQPEFQGAFFKMILAVIAVIVLGFITFWAFRKLTRARIEAANSNKAIKVLEKRILSPKSILYLIEYEGKKILISELS